MDDNNDNGAAQDNSAQNDEHFDMPPFGMMVGASPLVSADGVGPAMTAAFNMAQQHMRPEIVAITEPGTDLEVYVQVDKDGVHALPESLFDEYRTEPKRRRGVATLLDLDSFIAHVNRFSDNDTVIFADNRREAPKLTAVLDYHRAGAASDPRFGNHRSTFAFPLSDEWKAWTGQDDTKMTMGDFARFLEDHIIDVLPIPMISLEGASKLYVDTLGGMGKVADPSKLMQMASEFQVFENSVVKSAQSLNSGETAIEFASEHMDAQGQKLVVPTMFVLGIPVFKGEAPYQVIARLRYRKSGSQITFWYELWRTDLVFDHAFDESISKVKAGTNREVMVGFDEGSASTTRPAARRNEEVPF